MCHLYVLDSRSYHTQSGSVFPVFPKSELSLFYIDYGRKGADDDDDDDGQLGEIRIEASTRFWRARGSERVFSSVRAARRDS